MSIGNLWRQNQTIAIVCYQWGDSGKGKIVDLLAEGADIIERGHGGANAGHTVWINGVKYVFHLTPSGSLYDAQGKKNVLGNGMVIDLEQLVSEMKVLDKAGVSFNNLMVSEDASVVLPWHLQKDQFDKKQEAGGIGTTGRGIGPAYEDKASRKGILVRDILKPDTLIQKLRELERKYAALEKTYPQQVDHISAEQIYNMLIGVSRDIKPYVTDTISFTHDALRKGKKILFEGAHGTLLGIEHGTKKYVTSSDCSVNGLASGAGIGANQIDYVIGIVKWPYLTRVGGGPLPSELGGMQSERYCGTNSNDLKGELISYGIPFEEKDGAIRYDHSHPNIMALLNSKNDLYIGAGLRLRGEEFGATTGRPRRTGWTDLVALQHAIACNGGTKRGGNLFLTKVDVAQGMEHFSLVDSYSIDGRIVPFTTDSEKLRKVNTSVMIFDGSNDDLSQITKFGGLPKSLLAAMEYTERSTGGRIIGLGTGCERDAYIMR